MHLPEFALCWPKDRLLGRGGQWGIRPCATGSDADRNMILEGMAVNLQRLTLCDQTTEANGGIETTSGGQMAVGSPHRRLRPGTACRLLGACCASPAGGRPGLRSRTPSNAVSGFRPPLAQPQSPRHDLGNEPRQPTDSLLTTVGQLSLQNPCPTKASGPRRNPSYFLVIYQKAKALRQPWQ